MFDYFKIAKVLTLGGLVFLSSLAFGQALLDSNSTIHALVIGISDYEHINNLSYAEKDAQVFREYVGGAYRDTRIIHLVDSIATRENIVMGLAEIADEAKLGDTILFYFSGHGDCETSIIGEPGFLLSYDSPQNNYLISAIRLDDLKLYIETYVETKGATAILFIDSCRAGKLQQENTKGPGKTSASLMNLFQNEILFLGCKPDQYSLEKGKFSQGLFTYFLLKGLSGDADIDTNSQVNVEELRRFLFDAVMKESGATQTPIVTGDPLVVIAKCPEIDTLLSDQVRTRNFYRPKASNTSDLIDSIPPNKHMIKEALDEAIEKGFLLEPKDTSIRTYLDTITIFDNINSIGPYQIKVSLLEHLLKGSSLFLHQYIASEEKIIPEVLWMDAFADLQLGLELIPERDSYFQAFYSRKLFLEAYEIRYAPLIEEKDWTNGISLLNESLSVEPFSAFAYNELGYAYWQIGELERAKGAFSNAVDLSSEWKLPRKSYDSVVDYLESQRTKNPSHQYEDGLPDQRFDLRKRRNCSRPNGDCDRDGVKNREDDCPETPGVAATRGCPDLDTDGIEDSKDPCPELAGDKAYNGCPDSDGDDVPDNIDACPSTPGKRRLRGCPDSDDDGIADPIDFCPSVFGVAALDGCPDSDLDGITDAEDACPQMPGRVEANGCPDADLDGIIDPSDKCVDIPGFARFGGCPDRDNDGIGDADDACPSNAGPIENDGCPIIQDEDIAALELAMRNVRFRSGSGRLLTVSHSVLDEVAGLMQRYPNYNLIISGYSDDMGNDAVNQELSEERALACYEYLFTRHDVPRDRMSYVGYGESNPVDTNETPVGRARNRRVEFELTIAN